MDTQSVFMLFIYTIYKITEFFYLFIFFSLLLETKFVAVFNFSSAKEIVKIAPSVVKVVGPSAIE